MTDDTRAAPTPEASAPGDAERVIATLHQQANIMDAMAEQDPEAVAVAADLRWAAATVAALTTDRDQWKTLCNEYAARVAALTAEPAMTRDDASRAAAAVDPATAGAAGPETVMRAAFQEYVDRLIEADARVATLEARLTKYENDEGACCPEDVGFVEYIATLEARTAEDALLLAQYKQTLIDVQRHATEGQRRDEERIAGLEARLHDAERDAGRWRAIRGCQRVRLLGHARLGQPDQHIGFELWEQYPPDTIGTTGNDVSRADLTTFADAAAARATPRGAP